MDGRFCNSRLLKGTEANCTDKGGTTPFFLYLKLKGTEANGTGKGGTIPFFLYLNYTLKGIHS